MSLFHVIALCKSTFTYFFSVAYFLRHSDLCVTSSSVQPHLFDYTTCFQLQVLCRCGMQHVQLLAQTVVQSHPVSDTLLRESLESASLMLVSICAIDTEEQCRPVRNDRQLRTVSGRMPTDIYLSVGCYNLPPGVWLAFLASEHHQCLDSTKLYCVVTKACMPASLLDSAVGEFRA